MNLFLESKIPLDKSRFFFELIKFNTENQLRNFCPSFTRSIVEIYFNKGLFFLNSPYLSGTFVILSRNNHNIFHFLLNTFFISKGIKAQSFDYLLSIGLGFLNHFRFLTLTGMNLSSIKRKNIFNLFLNHKRAKNFELNSDYQLLTALPELKFLLLSKFIILETGVEFYKYNPFIVFWKIKQLEFINDKKNYKEKKYELALKKFYKILSVETSYEEDINWPRTNHSKRFRYLMPDLYENCIYQKVYLASIFFEKSTCKTEKRIMFGSNIFFCNFEINYSSSEKKDKISQRNLTPVHSFILKSKETRLCYVERKKNCLDSYLNNFQDFLLNKMEIFSKRFNGCYVKLFFQFNLRLPKFLPISTKLFSLVKTNKDNNKCFYKKQFKNFSIIFLKLFKTILTFYFIKTNDKLLTDTLFLMINVSIDKFSKIESIIFYTKYLQKKEKLMSNEVIGKSIKNFFIYFSELKKKNNLKVFYSALFSLVDFFDLESFKFKIAHSFFRIGLNNRVYCIVKKKKSFLSFFKTWNMQKNNKSFILSQRKFLSRCEHLQRIPFLIIMARLNRNIKYYTICFWLYPKFRILLKYSIGIALNEDNKSLHSKKYLSTSLYLNPKNKKGWYYLGTLLFQNREFLAAINCFHKILFNDPENSGAKKNLNLCTEQFIDSKLLDPMILKNYLRKHRISEFLVLKIFYNLINKKKLDFIFIIIDYLFELKKLTIVQNNIFSKEMSFFFCDFITKDYRFHLNCRKISLIFYRNINSILNFSFYKSFCKKINSQWRFFQYIIKICRSFKKSSEKSSIILEYKKIPYLDFTIEEVARFLNFNS